MLLDSYHVLLYQLLEIVLPEQFMLYRKSNCPCLIYFWMNLFDSRRLVINFVTIVTPSIFETSYDDTLYRNGKFTLIKRIALSLRTL